MLTAIPARASKLAELVAQPGLGGNLVDWHFLGKITDRDRRTQQVMVSIRCWRSGILNRRVNSGCALHNDSRRAFDAAQPGHQRAADAVMSDPVRSALSPLNRPVAERLDVVVPAQRSPESVRQYSGCAEVLMLTGWPGMAMCATDNARGSPECKG
jgi:hypothetical protein